MVDEQGTAVALKNNKPRYLIIDYAQASEKELATDEDVSILSKRLIVENEVSL